MVRRKPKSDNENLSYIAESLRPLAVPVDSLHGDPKNARKHGKEDLKAIAASLQEFGQVKPILVQEDSRTIIAGNGTWEATQKLGRSHIAVVFLKLDPKKQLGLAIADNRTAELSEWDDDRLAEAIGELQEEMPDLAADLLLDQLLELELPEDRPAVDVPVAFGIYVECKSEDEQQDVFERLKKAGYKVRVSTM